MSANLLKEMITEIATSMFYYNTVLSLKDSKPLASLRLDKLRFTCQLFIFPVLTGDLDENKDMFDFIKNDEDRVNFEFRTRKKNIKDEFYNTVLSNRVLLNSLCENSKIVIEAEKMVLQEVFGFKCIFEYKIKNNGFRVVK